MKTGYGRISVVNSTFIQTHLNDGFSNAKQHLISSNGCFLHSESAGPIIIKISPLRQMSAGHLYQYFQLQKLAS